MANIKLDDLDKAVKDILEDYAGDVKHNLDTITRDITKKGVSALKGESQQKFGTSGKHKQKYARTWTSKTEVGRMYTRGTIYNTQAGLPHLLENGHVSRNGSGRILGNVAGREHIAPVENELIRLFEREVYSKL